VFNEPAQVHYDCQLLRRACHGGAGGTGRVRSERQPIRSLDSASSAPAGGFAPPESGPRRAPARLRYLFTIQEEKWSAYHLVFRASVMGQPADGTIDVTTGAVSLVVALPWLFVILARAAQPLIVKEGGRILDRK
jgi:hypothetical protein